MHSRSGHAVTYRCKLLSPLKELSRHSCSYNVMAFT
jgi:hypothetical protein